ncbi:MAG: 4Fe-4S dicluster domain-containing protein, partial [Firmicutes bacterium]|nr:4Fe-4S dicluster domain-containing protein [Bacillota bacterium]
GTSSRIRRLGAPSEAIQSLIPGGVKSSAEMALRFVLSNPQVSVALSGMGSVQMVEENVATASRAEHLSQEERRRIAEIMEENRRLADLYCTGCNYCMPCPNGVNIPENFRYMNYHRVYGLKDYAREAYGRLGQPDNFVKGEKAESCLECGECETKCPQKLHIIHQLKEVARVLG